jgi:hypothetical protein
LDSSSSSSSSSSQQQLQGMPLLLLLMMRGQEAMLQHLLDLLVVLLQLQAQEQGLLAARLERSRDPHG